MNRFTGSTVWASLTDEERHLVGSLAVEWAYAALASSGLQEADLDPADLSPVRRAIEHAEGQLQLDLLTLLSDHLPEVESDVEDNGTRAISVPSLLGPVCRECGCSNNDACAGGCSWACADLCSACKILTPKTGAVV